MEEDFQEDFENREIRRMERNLRATRVGLGRPHRAVLTFRNLRNIDVGL